MRIKLKRPNHRHPCYPVGRHLKFPVTTTRYIPWVDFVFPSFRFGRLYHHPLQFSRNLGTLTFWNPPGLKRDFFIMLTQFLMILIISYIFISLRNDITRIICHLRLTRCITHFTCSQIPQLPEDKLCYVAETCSSKEQNILQLAGNELASIVSYFCVFWSVVHLTTLTETKIVQRRITG